MAPARRAIASGNQQLNGRDWTVLSNAGRGVSAVYQIDPLVDANWQGLLQRHPAASVFHSEGWLRALQRTYGYKPVVFTTSPAAVTLTNGLLCAQIHSRLTGRRVVSLPFSDHCAPLCESEEQLEKLILELQKKGLHQKWRYIELRPLAQFSNGMLEKLGFESTDKYLVHHVDLERSEGELFRCLHKNCVQRRIRHAERVGIHEVWSNGERHLRDFFELMVRTRRRHGLPPQPFAWFQNLLDCMKNGADLGVAYRKEIPIAAILILHFLDKSYYKYGCSDERFHNCGAIPFLMWRAILKAKSVGSKLLDLGRTDHDAHGLISFKNHWSNCSDQLNYWVWVPGARHHFGKAGKSRLLRSAFGLMPRSFAKFAGSVMYRHAG